VNQFRSRKVDRLYLLKLIKEESNQTKTLFSDNMNNLILKKIDLDKVNAVKTVDQILNNKSLQVKKELIKLQNYEKEFINQSIQ